jgi:hypothetical protein
MITQLVVGAIIAITGTVVALVVMAWAVCQVPAAARWVRLQYRRVRFRACVLLQRPVPASGDPLDPDEAHGFLDAMRGWELPAREPSRQAGRRPW